MQPTHQLQNWIPDLLSDWQCQDHNCGLDQIHITFQSNEVGPLTLPRLDARYDWLPSPALTFGDKELPAAFVAHPCSLKTSLAKGTVAITIMDDQENCSYSKMVRLVYLVYTTDPLCEAAINCNVFSSQVSKCQSYGAAAVIVMQKEPSFPIDMNCVGSECMNPPNIPAANIPYQEILRKWWVLSDYWCQGFGCTSCNFYFFFISLGLDIWLLSSPTPHLPTSSLLLTTMAIWLKQAGSSIPQCISLHGKLSGWVPNPFTLPLIWCVHPHYCGHSLLHTYFQVQLSEISWEKAEWACIYFQCVQSQHHEWLSWGCCKHLTPSWSVSN